jgi:hypothetical protein
LKAVTPDKRLPLNKAIRQLKFSYNAYEFILFLEMKKRRLVARQAGRNQPFYL